MWSKKQKNTIIVKKIGKLAEINMIEQNIQYIIIHILKNCTHLIYLLKMPIINPDIFVILSLQICQITRLIYENECLDFNSN